MGYSFEDLEVCEKSCGLSVSKMLQSLHSSLKKQRPLYFRLSDTFRTVSGAGTGTELVKHLEKFL